MSTSNCGISPTTAAVVWAQCEGGMLVTEWRSGDGGKRFEKVWTFAGTGGQRIDPVTACIVYPNLGFGPAFQRSTDGGRSFHAVGRLPFPSGDLDQLVFANATDGYALGSSGPPGNPDARLAATTNGGRTWSIVRFRSLSEGKRVAERVEPVPVRR